MSDDVRLLLIEGVAAAKSVRPESRQEARVRLEEVLQRTDAEPDQKAEAWLWLSRIEEDPRKKRLCLESVIALDPSNGSAHQGLAILDGRLRASDVMDPHEAVQPLEPPETPPATGVHRSVCPTCGGKVSFDTGLRALVCGYCGTQFPPYRAAVQDPVVQELDFFSALPTTKAHRWELPTERTLKCQGCGAAFTLPPLQVSGMCPFCESAAIVTSSSSELIEPTAVLPFQINRQDAEARIRTWITRRRFRPGDLEARAEISAPRGVFLPFWTFDLGGTMNWRAQIAERHGRTTRWVPREGLHLVYHDDVLVPASRSVPEALCERLFDYDTKPLLPFSPGLLTDHATEIYQVPLDAASVVARKHALEAGRAYEEENSLAGERVRNFVMNSAGLIVESYKLALLPLWVGGYRYKAGTFPVAVNGQTGTVTGQVPRSGLQRALAGLLGDC